MKKIRVLFCVLLIGLLFPLQAAAASEGDVYAALRSIGVPESYVSQAAGVLARGTSDGAGVYRSDGTYYSYDWMVSYVYANRETILLYCGIDPDTGGAVTSSASGTTEAAASGSTETTTVSSLPISQAIDMIFADDTTAPETTTSAATTTVTTTAPAAAATASSLASSTTSTTRSAVSVTEPTDSGKSGGTIAAACMILAAIAGLIGMSLLQRCSQ